MQNKSLTQDYLFRCQNRLAALNVLYERKSWADVVRESQEIVELALKALLYFCKIEIPRIHDVGDILLDNQSLLPQEIQPHCEKLSEVSKELRRDRELAFYGSTDLTPSEFYKEKDAKHAKDSAEWVVQIVSVIGE